MARNQQTLLWRAYMEWANRQGGMSADITSALTAAGYNPATLSAQWASGANVPADPRTAHR